MKSRNILIGVLSVIIVLLLVVIQYAYDQQGPRDFPHEDTFLFESSCDSHITLGDTATITLSLTNCGNFDYPIQYGKLYDVLVNGESIVGGEEGSSGGSTLTHDCKGSPSYTFTPRAAGVYEITAIAAFDVELPASDSKKVYFQPTAKSYRYEQHMIIEVTA